MGKRRIDGYAIAREYHAQPPSMTKAFVLSFVEPLYTYLLENIETVAVTFALLLRFKQKCEAFTQKELLRRFRENTQSGEINLSRFMQEYLHDRNIDVYINPESASGKVDFASSLPGYHPIIADSKVFSENKRNVGVAFRQVYRYCHNFNEGYGFLIVYVVKDVDLHIELPVSEKFYLLEYGGKRIYALTVDIADRPSASTGGKIKEVRVTKSDIIEIIEERDQRTTLAG